MTTLALTTPTVQMPSAEHMREIWTEFKRYVGDELVAPMAEFFRETPMRAAANCNVKWEQIKSNVKSFAIVNWVMRAGDDAIKTFDRLMGAGAAGGGWGFKPDPKAKVPGKSHGAGQNPMWNPSPKR